MFKCFPCIEQGIGAAVHISNLEVAMGIRLYSELLRALRVVVNVKKSSI